MKGKENGDLGHSTGGYYTQLEVHSHDREDLCRTLATGAEKRGLGLCLWKDLETFPRLLGTDLDVLLPRRFEAEFESYLHAELATAGWECLHRFARGHLVTYMLARCNARAADLDAFLQLDVHTALTSRGIPFVAAADLIRRSWVRNGVRWLHPSDAAVVSWLEPVLNGVLPKAAYVSALRVALEKDPQRVRQLFGHATGSLEIEKLLADPEEAAMKPRLWPLRYFIALLRRPMEVIGITWRNAMELLRGYFFSPMLMWALSGPDGAGKSEVASLFAPMVSRRIVASVTLLHTRPYLLPRLAKIVPFSVSRREAILTERRYEQSLGALKSTLRLLVALADYQIGYWIAIRPRLGRGTMVLFDRYFQDYLVDSRIRGIDLPPVVLRAASLLVPKVHVHVYLLASPETLTSRKGELDQQEASEQAGAYARIAASDPRAVTLQTDGIPASDVALSLADRLLELSRKRNVSSKQAGIGGPNSGSQYGSRSQGGRREAGGVN